MNRKSIKIANQTAAQTIPFVVLQDSWVQLSPYGDFPHGKGLQRVDRTAAETLTSNFHSFSGKLGRRFAGVPFYVGHPDVPGFENTYPDQKAYGWVMALESRDDGVYGQIKWSKAGNELLENAHYKFLSPYWEAAEIGFEKGRKVFRPHSLISVGLTNQPNIPVLPLANSENTPESEITILTTLGLDPSATREEILQHLAATTSTSSIMSTPSTSFVPSVPSVPSVPQNSLQNTALENTLANLACQLETEKELIAQDRIRYRELESQFQTFNERFLNSIVETAITQGKILSTEREHWLGQLEKDFETKTAELANAKPVLKTEFTRRFSNTNTTGAPDSIELTKKIQQLVQDKMKTSGIDYDRAWQQIKTENPALFTVMQTPAAPAI
jgi:phage I-like protein